MIDWTLLLVIVGILATLAGVAIYWWRKTPQKVRESQNIDKTLTSTSTEYEIIGNAVLKLYDDFDNLKREVREIKESIQRPRQSSKRED